MAIDDIFNPNGKLPESSPLWFWLALGTLIVAVMLTFAPGTEGIMKPNGTVQNFLALKPGLTGVLGAVIFMTALFARGCLKIPEHPLIFLLLIGDLCLFASYLEIVFTGKEVVLCKMPDWLPFKDPSISPRFLASAVIVLTLIGARAIAGLGVLFLALVTLLHICKVEEDMGVRGVVFVISSFISLLLQLKIPGMHIDKLAGLALLANIGQDFKKIGGQAKENIDATGKAVRVGTQLAAKIVAAGVAQRVTKGATAFVAPGTVEKMDETVPSEPLECQDTEKEESSK